MRFTILIYIILAMLISFSPYSKNTTMTGMTNDSHTAISNVTMVGNVECRR